MLVTEKKLPNKALDFVMGGLGLLGLIIQLVRQNDNEISWGHFVGGFVAATVAGALLIAACVAAVDETVDEVMEDIERTQTEMCHYDSMMDTSIVISGSLRNSQTTYYSGNVCN